MRGLIFSGIGSYAIYEAAVVSKLNQPYQMFAGTGFGSFNAAYLCHFNKSQFGAYSPELLRLMSSLESKDVYATKWWRSNTKDLSPFWNWTQKHLDQNKMRDSDTSCKIHFMDRDNLQRKWLTDTSFVSKKWVQTSCCTPLIHEARKLESGAHMNGSLIVPIDSLVSLCTQIDIILPFNPRIPRGPVVGPDPVQFVLDTQRSLWLRELSGYINHEHVDFMIHFPREQLVVNPLDFGSGAKKRLVDLGMGMYSVKADYLL